VRTAISEHGAGSILIPFEDTPGLHGVVVVVRDDLTAEPPAHCRLVPGHDPFGMVASLDCTVRLRGDGGESWGESGASGTDCHSPR
jgi:hypothetical protein